MGGECVAPLMSGAWPRPTHVGGVAPTYSLLTSGTWPRPTHVGDVAPTYDTPVGRPHVADGFRPHVADDTHKHPKQQAHTTRIRST